jgi:hypothetical protein
MNRKNPVFCGQKPALGLAFDLKRPHIEHIWEGLSGPRDAAFCCCAGVPACAS